MHSTAPTNHLHTHTFEFFKKKINKFFSKINKTKKSYTHGSKSYVFEM